MPPPARPPPPITATSCGGSEPSSRKPGQRRRIASSTLAPRATDGDSTPTARPPRWVSSISGSRCNWLVRLSCCNQSISRPRRSPWEARSRASRAAVPPPRPAANGPHASSTSAAVAANTTALASSGWG